VRAAYGLARGAIAIERLTDLAQAVWYGGHPLALVLTPLSWLYRGGVALRRVAYRAGLRRVGRCTKPVVVVGNLTVGGTGKTPLVVWLAECLRRHGCRPGIVTRGYGGEAGMWPQEVRTDSDPAVVGDEPVLLARRARCPVVVGPDRYRAAEVLLERCDVIVSDDGLQHLALHRDLEIAVIDAVRRFGNGRLLPAGPLREPLKRLASVDLVVENDGQGGRDVVRALAPLRVPGRVVYPMQCGALSLRSLADDHALATTAWQGCVVHAVAGIGHPERFFAILAALGFGVIPHPYPDHHRFAPSDITFADGLPVIMTEKDAVKCRRFAAPGHWYLPIAAHLPPEFEQRLIELLRRECHG
jgi:tetraacyldisaccharide 4'-kinase